EGDVALYLGCSQVASSQILQRNRHNLVVHESALPSGKGWSPLTWQILEGKNCIPITLFEAVERIDSGQIYLQETMEFTGYELIDELRAKQASASFRMCQIFLQRYPDILGEAKLQTGQETFYPRRRPEDSKLDIDKSIREQFNLLRVVDNERYPAYFEIDGHRYTIAIYKK
ncbi:MAG: formyltransferase family protein, partial [Bacteroidota bacterium]|nr:UDP-2,4-diacetamido-2,4,6-trideoxy-beta-L-altropyranose hydrolase [Candidatus Kapabacteria bacterium]MDW8219932.1 formyltransferase family protein [Bacteroidota bacterium]